MKIASPPQNAHVIASDAEAIETAKRLAAEFSLGASDRDRERLLPWAELDAFTASGLWGITIPREHGGAAVSAVTLARIIAIIAAADGSLAQIPQNHFYALEVQRSGGKPQQRAHFDVLALSGHRFGHALAEIGARDFQRRTRLLREGERLLVQGDKFYCTGAPYAHWIPTLVLDQEDREQLVFIPRDAPGVTITDDWDGFGQRTTGSGSVALRAVEVQAEWIIPFQSSFESPTPIGPLGEPVFGHITAVREAEVWADRGQGDQSPWG